MRKISGRGIDGRSQIVRALVDYISGTCYCHPVCYSIDLTYLRQDNRWICHVSVTIETKHCVKALDRTQEKLCVKGYLLALK